MTEFEQMKRFFAAGDELNRILEEGGKDALNLPEHGWLFAEMMEAAPPEMKARFSNIAHEMGLFPRPTMRDVAGNAVYSIEEVAKHLNVSVDELESRIQDLPVDSTYTGPIVKVQ